MTDWEWAVVRPLLPVPGWMRGRGGRPEAYCHRAILDAIRYLVDNGIKWRAMPADFPPWDRIYAFFRRWRDNALVKEFHDRLRGRVREELGRDAEPTAAVIDSQSVKADAVVGADSRGFDGGKLVNGRKRHVVVDTLGLLLGVMVTAADVGDRTAARVAGLGHPIGLLVLYVWRRGASQGQQNGAAAVQGGQHPARLVEHEPCLVAEFAVQVAGVREPQPVEPLPHGRLAGAFVDVLHGEAGRMGLLLPGGFGARAQGPGEGEAAAGREDAAQLADRLAAVLGEREGVDADDAVGVTVG
jgi:transposase